MNWLKHRDIHLSPKPIVIIEDHLFHLGEILGILDQEAPDFISQMTLVCLDRPGPDTCDAIGQWLQRYVDLQIAAWPGEFKALPETDRSRLYEIDPIALESAANFCRQMALLLRPKGLLIQDIQLNTLSFIPESRWWESIYLANTIRGMFPDRTPSCQFMSNKTGFEATFGADLMDAGFDPRDVLGKTRLSRLLVPILLRFKKKNFPKNLEFIGDDGWLQSCYSNEQETEEIDAHFDLVLRLDLENVRLSGKLVKPKSGKKALLLKSNTQEAQTWMALFEAYLQQNKGVPTIDVGERLAADGALKGEMSNVAARHIHNLRSRLTQSEVVVTADHCYRITSQLNCARVQLFPDL